MRKINSNKYIIDQNKLLKYGFIKEKDSYKYTKLILDNEFKIEVEYKNNIMTSKLIEVAFNDEYMQADSTVTGEYANTIKTAYEEELNNIKDKCFIKQAFKEKQTNEIIKYIKEKYNCNPEFLWEKYDDTAAIRNNKNNKWFGIFMEVNKTKLGLDEDKQVEIIDLSYYKNRVDEVIDNKGIFPGYHMNKKSWITIILDGTVSIEEIEKLIDISYEISISKK